LKNWDAAIDRMLGEEVRAEAVSPDSEESNPLIRADFLTFASKKGLAHLRWKNSTTNGKQTLDWLVEESVAQLFYRM